MSTPSPRSPWLVPLIVLVTASVALGIGFMVVRHDNLVTSNSRFNTVQTACEDWADSTSNASTDGVRCSGMVSWMRHRMGGTMMGSDPWEGPQQMRDACHRWARGDAEEARGWTVKSCDDMVRWMDEHAADGWDDWMMHGR